MLYVQLGMTQQELVLVNGIPRRDKVKEGNVMFNREWNQDTRKSSYVE